MMINRMHRRQLLADQRMRHPGHDRGDDVFLHQESREDRAIVRQIGEIPMGPTDARNQAFAAHFSEIVGCMSPTILGLAPALLSAYRLGKVLHPQALMTRSQREQRPQHGPHTLRPEIEAGQSLGAHLGWTGDLVQNRRIQERRMGRPQHVQKAQDHLLQRGHQQGQLRQHFPLLQCLDIMGDPFDTQHAFAFVINLQRQQAEVDFEDGQIMSRSLERALQSGGSPLGRLMFEWTTFGSKERGDGFDIKLAARSVDHLLEDPVDVRAVVKDQVAAILQLIAGEGIVKPRLFLFGLIQRKDQASQREPALNDLDQSPYSRLSRQGICVLIEACPIIRIRETISFFGEGQRLLGRMAFHPFMSIEHDGGVKGGMSADLDTEMAPFRVLDMKIIMIDIGPFVLDILNDHAIPFDRPDGVRGARHQRIRKTPRNRTSVGDLFRQFMLCVCPFRNG